MDRHLIVAVVTCPLKEFERSSLLILPVSEQALEASPPQPHPDSAPRDEMGLWVADLNITPPGKLWIPFPGCKLRLGFFFFFRGGDSSPQLFLFPSVIPWEGH